MPTELRTKLETHNEKVNPVRALMHRTVGYGSRILVLREALTILHRVRHRHEPWMRQHPFDTSYGTTTNGTLPPWLLRSGEAADAHVTVYAGCQPSCLRHALAVIPHPADHTFVDLGCGKGRALVLASELPFRRIVGIELAPGLVAAARRNARIVQRNHPRRSAIEIVQGDATAVPFPEGNLVFFLYHSFGRELVARMLSRIADAVAGTERTIFLIYENPVNGDLIDGIDKFTRWYCQTVPCETDELGLAPDDEDTVVVWRISGGPLIPPKREATTSIVVTKPGWRAVLATG
jgi:SAM-dependent methyltransferase